jgi:membrane-bound serine protease (ClpP class)
LGVTLPFAVIVIFLMRLVLRSRAWRPAVGAEQLVGREAEVTGALSPDETPGLFSGMVRMHGELWRATAHEAVPAGAQVRVVRVDGLTLHVKPAEAHSAAH